MGGEGAPGEGVPAAGARGEEAASVDGGLLKRTSASAITKFDEAQPGGCPRKWWYRYVERRPEPQGKSARLGVEVHAQIARWLETGEQALGPVALAAKAFAEPQASRQAVEARFDGAELQAAGVPVVGFIDLARWRDGVPEALDWKTTGADLRDGPPRSGRSLLLTVQMPAYGNVLLGTGADKVRLTHAYLSTRRPGESAEATAVFSRAELEDRWAEVCRTVEAMKVCAGALRAEDVPANLSACSAYGGCVYRDVCPRGLASTVADVCGVDPMSLLDMLNGTNPEVEAAKAKLLEAEAASIRPPDAPKETLAFEPVPEEALASLPPAVVEKVKKARGKKGNAAGRITKVTFGRTVQPRQYESARVELEAEVPEGVDHREVLKALVDEVEAAAEALRGKTA